MSYFFFNPCQFIFPHTKKLAETYANKIAIMRTNVDQESGLAMGRYQVTGMPTFVMMKNGQEIDRFSGADAKKLAEKIREHAQ